MAKFCNTKPQKKLDFFAVHPYLCNMTMKIIEGYTPYGFQQKSITAALNSIKEFGGCCIFDETGLGKTIIGATIAANLDGERILVISPKAHQKSWSSILPTATICTRAKIPVADYDTVIVDEADNFGNPKNKSYACLQEIIFKQIQARFPNVVLLTATPVNNNITELYHMVRLIPFGVNSSAFYTVPVAFQNAITKEKELLTFERFNVDPETELAHNGPLITQHVDLAHAYRNAIEDCGMVMKEFCFRNTRQGITENYSGDIELMGHFPLLNRFESTFELDGEAITKTLQILDKMPFAYYNILKYTDDPKQTGVGGIMKTLLMKRLDSSVKAFLETVRNIQATHNKIPLGGPVVVDQQTHFVGPDFFSDVAIDKQFLAELENIWLDKNDNDKINKLISLIDATDGKVVVFTEYTATQQLIVDALKDRYPLMAYNGSSDEKTFDAIALEFDRNQDKVGQKIKVLVATDALSVGVNLHAASTLVHFDLKWNPSRLIQREGRVDRLVKVGLQVGSIAVHTFAVNALVEKVVRLEKKLNHKSDLAELILCTEKQLVYANNVKHSSYLLQLSGVGWSYLGLTFPKGTLFFKINEFRSDPTTIISPRLVPPVEVKKIQKEQHLGRQFLKTSIPSNIAEFYFGQNVDKDFKSKMLYLVSSPLYYDVLVANGRKPDDVNVIENFVDKFWSHSPSTPKVCSTSSYLGDEVIPNSRIQFN